MPNDKLHKVIISGGGTGGHVFPAIAIADAIRRRYPDCEILFVGAKGRMEMEKVPAAGYTIEGLNIAGLQRRLTLKNLSFPFKLIGSLLKARRIVKKFKPQAAIGVGGYASGPTLRAAGNAGIPTFVQEQNSYPGITNKLLAKKALALCVAYDNMNRFFPAHKIEKTGNPVRKAICEPLPEREAAVNSFGLDPSRKVLFILGGSLGAMTLNESVKAFLENIAEENVQVIWQCGKYYEADLKPIAGKYKNIHLTSFIQDMNQAYAAADVVVSRAGALSVSELCIVGKPVIFVPSPNVSEDHQTKNARALIEKEAAIMISDAEAREKLIPAALELIMDAQKCNDLSTAIQELGIPDADERIVDVIEKHLRL